MANIEPYAAQLIHVMSQLSGRIGAKSWGVEDFASRPIVPPTSAPITPQNRNRIHLPARSPLYMPNALRIMKYPNTAPINEYPKASYQNHTHFPRYTNHK